MSLLESLPVEVLVIIMEFVKLDNPSGQKDLLNVMLVCHSFRRVAEPMLYSHLSLGVSDPTRDGDALIQARLQPFLDLPNRRSFIRELSFFDSAFSPKDPVDEVPFSGLYPLMMALPALEIVDFCPSPDLSQQLRLDALREVTLDFHPYAGSWYEEHPFTDLHVIAYYLRAPRLESLTVVDLNWPPSEDIQTLFPAPADRTSSVTSLAWPWGLYLPSSTALFGLSYTIKALESFTLVWRRQENSHRDYHNNAASTAIILQALRIHQSTLREISLENHLARFDEVFHFRNFTALTKLSIPLTTLTRTAFLARVLPPSLVELCVRQNYQWPIVLPSAQRLPVPYRIMAADGSEVLIESPMAQAFINLSQTDWTLFPHLHTLSAKMRLPSSAPIDHTPWPTRAERKELRVIFDEWGIHLRFYVIKQRNRAMNAEMDVLLVESL